jgi:hypothetical protein
MKDRLIRILIEALSEELILQGHKNTGSLIKSFEGRLMADGLGVEIWGGKYAHYLDKGVKWQRKNKRPPVKPLIEYFKQKGVADPESAAYATINSWKKGGMPTANSFKYSRTGKRKGFIKEALRRNNKNIDKEMFSDATRKMNKKISKIFNQLEAHGGGSGFGGGGVWVF